MHGGASAHTSRDRLAAPGFPAGALSSDDVTSQLANTPAAASPIDSRHHVLHRDSGENPD
jgi:hypothetical protein